jgi:hypothetical protein
MARRGYPPEFRRRVVDLVEAGRKVSEIASELEVSEQTIYVWRRQARIDAGLEVAGGSKEGHAYPVELTSTPCHFGGSRLWFLCPLVAGEGACRRRCRTLFPPYGAGHFGCRECLRLTYASRQRHRDLWHEAVGRMLALEREELRRPFCTLSPKESRRREAERKRVSDAMERFNERWDR